MREASLILSGVLLGFDDARGVCLVDGQSHLRCLYRASRILLRLVRRTLKTSSLGVLEMSWARNGLKMGGKDRLRALDGLRLHHVVLETDLSLDEDRFVPHGAVDLPLLENRGVILSEFKSLDLLGRHFNGSLLEIFDDAGFGVLRALESLLMDLILDLFFSHPSYSLLHFGTLRVENADSLAKLDGLDDLRNLHTLLIVVVDKLIGLTASNLLEKLGLKLLVLCLHLVEKEIGLKFKVLFIYN